jgi:hypothetical protein
MERRDFIKSAVASAVTAGATLSDSGRRKARPVAATRSLVQCRQTCNTVTWGAPGRRFR